MFLFLGFMAFLWGLVPAGRASAFESELKTESQIEDFIIYTAMKQEVPVDLALSIAKCESGLNPLAKAKTSSASGIFQFIKSTWNSTVKKLLWGENQDVFDPKLNIIAGIFLLKTEGASHWECWSKKML